MQKMADLPTARVTATPPFKFTGVDYFGPLNCFEERTEKDKKIRRYFDLPRCVAIKVKFDYKTWSFTPTFHGFLTRFITTV